MSIQNVIRTMVEYHVSTNLRLWEHILEYLTDEQFVKEVGFSHGSIRNQVVHLAATDRYWLHDIQSKPVIGLEPEDFPTRESFGDLWKSIEESLLAYVRSLTDEALQQIPDGLLDTRWQALVHIVNHGTDHRAQILSMFHGLGAPTFGQDFPDSWRAFRRVSVAEALGLVRYWNGRLQQSVQQVPRERLSEPVSGSWTLKDLLAQLAWYERETAEALNNRQFSKTGLWEQPRKERDRQIALAARDQSWEDMLEKRDEAFRSLVGAIEQLDDEDLNDPSRFKGIPPGTKPWEVLEANIWSQYMARAEALWAWLKS